MKLVWITVLFVAVVAWLILDHPKYEKQVDELGARIRDHVASIRAVERDLDRFDARWPNY